MADYLQQLFEIKTLLGAGGISTDIKTIITRLESVIDAVQHPTALFGTDITIAASGTSDCLVSTDVLLDEGVLLLAADGNTSDILLGNITNQWFPLTPGNTAFLKIDNAIRVCYNGHINDVLYWIGV